MYWIEIDQDENTRRFVEDEEGTVAVEFPDHDEESPANPQSPEAWINSAGVRVKGDGVQVWISTGDPRGGFTMEARRMADGRIVLHLPHPGEGMPHEETEELHPGTLLVTRSKGGL